MATPIPPNRAPLTPWSAAAATGGTIARLHEGGARAIGVFSDSRAVVPGSAFVALHGESHDGHDYLAQAHARGARLFVVARGREIPALDGADVVEVDDTLDAWGALAAAHVRAWRRSHDGGGARVVAITGSAGKTTTKELCAALLSAAAPTLATAGNLNNRVGAPAMAFLLEPTHRFAVLEMGMSVVGEIARLAAIAPPDVAVITNVGVAHAEGVGGRQGVAREKGALYAALPESGIAIVNADDDAACGQLARTVARRAVSFGRGEGARYRLVDRAPRGDGSRVEIARGDARIAVDLPLVGEAAAIDLVAALAAAEAALGAPLPPMRIDAALAAIAPPPGRAARVALADGAVILDDSYNANPASMRAALQTLGEIAAAEGRRAVAVLGEMKELGADSDAEHDALADAIAAAGVALAIGCGGEIDRALDRAAAAGVSVRKTTGAAAAAEVACAEVRPTDVVLVKGSRSVATEKVVEALARTRGAAVHGASR